MSRGEYQGFGTVAMSLDFLLDYIVRELSREVLEVFLGVDAALCTFRRPITVEVMQDKLAHVVLEVNLFLF